MKSLTIKQEAYVRALLQGMSQRDAYREAYPSSRAWAIVAVDAKASELIHREHVAARYALLRDRVVEAAARKGIMSAADVLVETSRLAEARITDYLRVETVDIVTGYEPDGSGQPDKSRPIIRSAAVVQIYDTDSVDRDKLAAVASIKQGRSGIEIKLHDKTKALELLGKHYKVFEDTQKVEHSGSINVVFSIPRPPAQQAPPKQRAQEGPPAEDVTG